MSSPSELRRWGGLLLLACLGSHEAVAQARPIGQEDLVRIFASGGDVGGWDEFDVPEFVAATYGAGASAALQAILRERSTASNYYPKLEALTTARYARVQVPVGLLLEYAAGLRLEDLPLALAGVLRQRAVLALSERPEPVLRPFWEGLKDERSATIRQYVAPGLACALAEGATTEIEALVLDSVPLVADVARGVLRSLASEGSAARVCGGRVSRAQAGDEPRAVRPQLEQAARRYLGRIP